MGTGAPAGAGFAEGDRFGRLLGLEMIEVTPERVRARLVAGPQHHQPYGILHGGVYCAIVEAVASYGAGYSALALGKAGVLGVANSTDFLRPHSVGELVAEGTPIRAGRRQQLWAVEVRRGGDGALVARGQVRFHVLDEAPAGAAS